MTLGTNSMWDAAVMEVIKFAYSNFFYIQVNFNHHCDCILYACMIHPCNIKCNSISDLLDYVSSLILHMRVLCKRTIWGVNVRNYNSHQTFNLLEITQGWGSLGKKWPMWSQEPVSWLTAKKGIRASEYWDTIHIILLALKYDFLACPFYLSPVPSPTQCQTNFS